ncbi:MAG: 3-dehydroquinate dehydratase [Deltaproteobacteria bacterium]|nr:3-dehydroquinate dehydratase [Deltaproteobacteria bacterium]
MRGKRAFRILFVDGPNLNVLGEREPSVYGRETLADIREAVKGAARREGATVAFFNPAAYTHTSVAVRDALIYAGLPAIEVHLTNPASREDFRRVSLVEDVVAGRICGVGGYGYTLALLALLHRLRREGSRGRP